MPRYCLTFDLQNDPKKIAEYKRRHEKIWPEIRDSLFDAGILAMEIYLSGTRLFMIMDVNDSFSLDKKAEMDRANPKVQEWEPRWRSSRTCRRARTPSAAGHSWRRSSTSPSSSERTPFCSSRLASTVQSAYLFANP